jgi:hypothetical protein
METLETDRPLIIKTNNKIIGEQAATNIFYNHYTESEKLDTLKGKKSTLKVTNSNIRNKIDFSQLSSEKIQDANLIEKLDLSNPDNSKCNSEKSSKNNKKLNINIKSHKQTSINNNFDTKEVKLRSKYVYKPESADLLLNENLKKSETRNHASNDIFKFESDSLNKTFNNNTLTSKTNFHVVNSISSSENKDNKISINYNEDKEMSNTTKPEFKQSGQMTNDLNTISTTFNLVEENNSLPKVNYNRALVLERWAKTKRILKGVIAFQKMSENIQLFGVSDEDFDDNKYLKTLKSMRTRYIKDKQDDEDDRKDSYQSISINLTTKPKTNFFKSFLKMIKIPIFTEKNLFVFVWSILIGFLMLYVVFITPYTLAFSDDNSQMDDIETVINYIFIADILVNFNLSYQENTVEITDRKMIAINYLKTWFILDLLASFPFEYITLGKSSSVNLNLARSNKIIRVARISKIYKLTKIFRVFKISRFVKRVKIINSIQDYFNINYGLSRLITFIISSCLFSHIVGCIWYFVPILYDEVNNWVTHNNLSDESNFRKYLFSLYWSFTTIFTVGFGDITPINEVEYILTIIWILFGVAFYSFTIGTLSTILVNMNTKTNLLSRNLSIINDYCKDTNLSEELMKEMKRVITFRSNNNIFSWIEKQEIFNNLPANLKCNVSLL